MAMENRPTMEAAPEVLADSPQIIADPLPPLMRELIAEVRQLRHECNRLWLLAFTPKERQEFLLDRLDRAAELASTGDVDAHLDEAWRDYLSAMDPKGVDPYLDDSWRLYLRSLDAEGVTAHAGR